MSDFENFEKNLTLSQKRLFNKVFNEDEEYVSENKDERKILKQLEMFGLIISNGGPLNSYNLTFKGVEYYNYVNLTRKNFKIKW